MRLDALVYSDRDELERGAAERASSRRRRCGSPPAGRRAEARRRRAGEAANWAAAPLPGPVADSYGCGDSFAAALCWALAEGHGPEARWRSAGRAGAVCMTGHGPYGRQLTAGELAE